MLVIEALGHLVSGTFLFLQGLFGQLLQVLTGVSRQVGSGVASNSL